MANDFKYDVFLSHSSKDKEPVGLLAKRLRDDGLRVWFDDWVVSPGDSIPAMIEEGLENSRVLVLCISANGIGSDWVSLESNTFRFRDPLNKERRFIPLRLDEAPLKGSLAQFAHVWLTAQKDQYTRLLAACRGEARMPNNRQHICMISPEYPPHVVGGLGIHVTQLSKELAGLADIELVLPARKNGYASTPKGLTARALATCDADYNQSTACWLHFAQHAFSQLESISPRPQIVHCHDWMTVLPGIKYRQAYKIPLLLHIHLPDRSPLCASVENLGIVCADLVTVSSAAMMEQIHKRFPGKKVAIVPNGVDTQTFRLRDPKTPEGAYILFAGRLVEQKGLDHLLRAFVHVLERFPEMRLKIAGTGPGEPAYRRLADCLLVGKQIEFCGKVEPTELSLLYQGALVTVVPSVYEPFGMTALEAMACGCPVVASDIGGLKEIVQPGVTGFLAEPGDYLDLAQWIMMLLESKELRQRLGCKAGREVHESSKYQWPQIAHRFASLYDKLSFEPVIPQIPQAAQEYVQQIRYLASRLELSLSSWLLDDIFKWETQ